MEKSSNSALDCFMSSLETGIFFLAN